MKDESTANQITEKADFLQRNVYCVPKWAVWMAATFLGIAAAYWVNDAVTHMDWPPYGGSNAEIIKANDCAHLNRPSYTVTEEQLTGDTSGKSRQYAGFDRQVFFDHAECMAAVLYLHYEGSGVRQEFNIYDMTTKRKTAHFVITHEKFDQ